ncbi:hypothetical protein [Streptomyces sp. NPDC058985]|uniref:hypothetical protein n=1 Tax=Streptomyces sp. NPDC058985 TaxID=3346684 RepID=UPI003684ABFA
MSTPFLLSTFMRYEVGAYEAVVLAAEGTCAELAGGRALGGRRREVVAAPCAEPTTSRTRGDQAEQRFEEASDEAEHV